MTSAVPGLPHLVGLIRSPRGGFAILGAFLLSTLLVIRAVAATLSVSTAALPDGAQSTVYNQMLTATGGTAPYSWDIVEGALPAGLSLSGGGVISGSPSVLANSAFTARVTDGDGNTATKSLAIKVMPQLTVATTALASGVSGVAYIPQTLAATGGTSPYTWAVTTGALPAGLSLNTSTGVISGTPTATAPAFIVTATDAAAHTATKSLTITVSPAGALTILTTSLPNAVIGTAYNGALTAAGGTVPYPATFWAVTLGALPAGLTLNAATGAITGTPTATAAAFTVTATDDSPLATATQVLTITVNAALVITNTDPLPAATAGTAYATVLAATGGTAPYKWTISAGSLPTGLTLFEEAGVISGVPTVAGPSSFTVQAKDANNVTITKPFSIAVGAAAAPTITTTALPNAILGSSYTYQLQRSGGVAPYTWSFTGGPLPSGLSLDASTGIITGIPPAGAVSAPGLTFQVNSGAGQSATKLLPITVSSAATLTITTTTLPDATINNAYSQTLARTGGTGPYTWSTVVAPPAWLTLNPTTGQLTGTPTAIAGAASFTVRVTDSLLAVDDQVLWITVVATGSLNITSTSLPNATINNAYSQTLARTGGTAPFTWSIIAAPPAWLTLNSSTGQLLGTPTALAGAASFTVRVTDAVLATDDQVLSITVGSMLTTSGTGTGNFFGPCKAFFKGSEMGQAQKSHATAFRRLIDAAGATAQVQAFCEANGQPESNEDQEFRRLCTSLFSGSNSWRSGGSKTSGMRRLIEAAGSADAVRNFCTTNFGSFTGQECDDDELHGVHKVSFNSRGNDNDDHGNKNNNKKKGKD